MKSLAVTWLTLLAVLALCLAAPACTPGEGREPADESSDTDATVSDTTGQDAADEPADRRERRTSRAADDEGEEALPVEVVRLRRGPIESVLRFSSNLEAENKVQVFSQAKRLVKKLLAEEGDRVQKGQLLLRLEDEEQRSALAKVRSQLDKAEREYRRRKRLFDEELISREEFTDAIYELEQYQISVADAERELTYAEVRAPISGIVTERLVNLGDRVQINQHLFNIVDFDSIVARIFVPEKYLPALRAGLKARIRAAATGSAQAAGEVDRIAPVVDPQSGTVKVTVAIDWQEGLRPGLYVDVDLVTATHEQALLVPKRAVVYDSDQMFVYRLADDNRVERVFIEPRLTDRDHVEPASGLNAGDRVVVAGQAGLKDNARVRLAPGAGAPDEPPADEPTSSEEAQALVERASK